MKKLTSINLIKINKTFISSGINLTEESLYISNEDTDEVINGNWQKVIINYYHLYRGIDLEREDEHILRGNTNDGTLLISFRNLIRQYI